MHRVKLFRIVSSTRRTDWVVTNDETQNSTSAAQQACDWRWKIEQFQRESKQLTGLEHCQCRLARIVRNHIGGYLGLDSTQASGASDQTNHLLGQT